MNNYQFDKKHLLSASWIYEFEKIMNSADQLEAPRNTSLIDLKTPLLDTKREQFMYQSGKEVHLNWHDSSSNNFPDASINVTKEHIQSDRAAVWSP